MMVEYAERLVRDAAARRWIGRAMRPGSPSGWAELTEESRVVKWWDRFWGVVWFVGSVWIGYLAARYVLLNATPAYLGAFGRYTLIAFAFLTAMLIGMAILSLAVMGVTIGLERLFVRLGRPLRRPAPAPAPPAAGRTSGSDEPPVSDGALAGAARE